MRRRQWPMFWNQENQEETWIPNSAGVKTAVAEQSDNHGNIGDSMTSGNGEQDLEAEKKEGRGRNGGIHGIIKVITGNAPSSGGGESEKHMATDADVPFFERMTAEEKEEEKTRPMKVQKKIKDSEENKKIEMLADVMIEKMQIDEMTSARDQTRLTKRPENLIRRMDEEERASLQQFRIKAISLGVDLSLLVAKLLFLVSDDKLYIKHICSSNLRSYGIKNPNGAVVSRFIDVVSITVMKIHAQKKEKEERQKGLVSEKQIIEFMFSIYERVLLLEEIFSFLSRPNLEVELSLLNVVVDNHREHLSVLERKIDDLKLQAYGSECETNGFGEEEVRVEMVELWTSLFGSEERKRGRVPPSW